MFIFLAARSYIEGATGTSSRRRCICRSRAEMYGTEQPAPMNERGRARGWKEIKRAVVERTERSQGKVILNLKSKRRCGKSDRIFGEPADSEDSDEDENVTPEYTFPQVFTLCQNLRGLSIIIPNLES